ncbi:hypothetical protein PY093_20345 [Cytobacillus sp. S13-E01]|uniref:hypothetical protein n=1 Tax=Cytobacillus sp. S13-E01 TaxID=3031326 RepID=UPI0023D899F5|nr:hypothetical protein [Cytobacillus sp. S13-E01]MDF0728967.1 hypothetical protein [Cytobacillus sp. S13-E01]
MGLNGKENNFRLDTFHHQLRTNCTEYGIHRSVIDRFIGQVEDIKRKDIWGLKKEEDKDAQDV